MLQQQQALEAEKRRRRRRVHISRCTFGFQKIVSAVKVDFIYLSQGYPKSACCIHPFKADI